MMSFFSFSKCFSHLITFYYLIAAFIISCSDVADGAFVPSSLKVRNHRSESIGFSPSNSSPLPIKNWNRIHPKKLRQQLNNEDNYYGGFDTSRVVREFRCGSYCHHYLMSCDFCWCRIFIQHLCSHSFRSWPRRNIHITAKNFEINKMNFTLRWNELNTNNELNKTTEMKRKPVSTNSWRKL